MNDEYRNDGEDPSAERVLAALEEGRLGGHPSPGVGGAEEDELLARLYTEVLGLVAYELPERSPRPEARDQLLAAVRRRGAAGAGAAAEPRGAEAGPVLTPFPAAGTTAEAPAEATARAVRDASEPRRRAPLPAWMLAMAATLLLAVLALGAFSGWLYARIGQQESMLAGLQSNLQQAERRAEELAAAQTDLERRRLDLSSHLSLITTPGVAVCPLLPVGDSPAFPHARGLVFFSDARGEWYVRLSGLGPAPEGRLYRLWFLIEGEGPVDAGRLRPGADDAIALAGDELPDLMRLRGVLVTIESEGADPEAPNGPQVLFGDEKMMMI